MSDPTYDLVQVDADGRIMDYMVREDIMSIAREAVPPSDGGGGIELPLAGSDVAVNLEGETYTAQEAVEAVYSAALTAASTAVNAAQKAVQAATAVEALEARVAALEADA